AASWGIVLRRARVDWLLLLVARLTILLATTLLAAGPIYTDAVVVSGLRRTLHDAPTAEANVEATATINVRAYPATDRTVTARLREAVAPIGATILRQGRSDSFALPGQAANDVHDLAVFAFIEGIAGHATLVAGAWPAATAAPYEVALPAPTAARLGYHVGDEVQLQSRLDPALRPRVRVVGIYRPTDATDPFWYGDSLELTGLDPGESFTTYGPFVVPAATLLGPLSPTAARITWHAYPNFDRLTADELPGLRASLTQLPARLTATVTGTAVRVDTQLPDRLAETEQSLLVTRSGVLIQVLQLAILIGYALVLTTGLLIESRRVEMALLHSRGAGNGQLLALAIVEGVLLALPAALLGPWLAALALRLLNVVGPLAPIGLGLTPVVGRPAILVAGGAGLACVVLLTLPWLGATRSLTQARAGRARQAARGLAQRAGLDLALLLIAALAYTQLRRYGAPLTRTLAGRLGIDPLLAAAPGLGLLAGAVIALRLLPLLARLAEVVARGGRPATAFGAWQVARRPQRYARAALLLILALGIGLFAAAYTRTWARSQDDQADYQVGADLRVQPDQRPETAIPPLQLLGTYRDVPGVRAAMPLLRQREEFSAATGEGDLILLDSRQAAAIVRFRGDLAPEPLAPMLARLTAGRRSPPVVPIPGQPRRLAFDLRLTWAAQPKRTGPPPLLSVDALLQDGDGVLYRVPLGPVRDDGQTARLIVPLGQPLAGGGSSRPAYPLGLVGLDISTVVTRVEERARVDLLGVRASDAAAGEDWGDVPLAPAPADWQLAQSPFRGGGQPPTIERLAAGPGSVLSLRLDTGVASRAIILPLTYGLRAGPPLPPAPIPILVDARLLERARLRVGDTIALTLNGASRQGQIVGALRGFPTLDPGDAPFIVADLPTLDALQTAPGAALFDPTEYWLAVQPGRDAAVAGRLRGAPFSSPLVLSRAARAAELRSNPLALGTIGALALGFAAAAAVAVLGFAVNAAASARERLAEFALLRAIGLHPRQLVAWLSLEQGLTVALSLLGGALLGLALTRLVLPLITLTQAGTAATPPARVVVPWTTVGLLTGGLLVALVGTAAILAASLRRLGLGATLRTGGE
ncbi:MAG TPA: FtsX-like permease family protein, partial [Thermomicrobiales bacterium]|nr:FtsX-like permease family protein [Thermomicrobiales bacterium]